MNLVVAIALLIASATTADAQGNYMLNGRATPSVIVGADRGIAVEKELGASPP